MNDSPTQHATDLVLAAHVADVARAGPEQRSHADAFPEDFELRRQAPSHHRIGREALDRVDDNRHGNAVMAAFYEGQRAGEVLPDGKPLTYRTRRPAHLSCARTLGLPTGRQQHRRV